MLEDFFGFKPEDDAPGKAEEVPEKPKRHPKAEETQKVRDAAVAVRDAVQAHMGKRKSVDAWKPVAAKVLGVSRLFGKRWQEVLDMGALDRLFRVDSETLAYPFIVVLPPPTPEDETQEQEGDLGDEDGDVWTSESPKPPDINPPPSKDPPENWNPPEVMDCGHLNWSLKKDKDGVEYCDGCKKKRVPVWTDTKGVFRKPFPESIRRTEEKVRMGGFEGYCCDAEGNYIGGDFNDCRRMNPEDSTKWCPYHQALKAAKQAKMETPVQEKPKRRRGKA
jgi:hypothetical protein